MHIRRLRLRNWLCYRGEHELALGPIAYGVQARHENDPERSNWAGKSALFEAVDFALYGHMNPDRRNDADGWITNGEPDGAVELELSTGVVVSRARKRGKSTQVRVGNAEKGEADRQLEQLVGLAREDFLASAYFRQRQIARLILAKPEERREMVGAWAGVEPLERCRQRAMDRVGDVASVLAEQRRRVVDAEAALASAEERMMELLAGSTLDQLAYLLASAAGERTRLEEVMSLAQRVEDTARHVAAHAARQEEASSLETALAVAAPRDLLATQAEASVAADRVARDTHAAAEREVSARRRLTTTGFDGLCPVARIACPARAEVDLVARTDRAFLDKASAEEAILRAARNEAAEAARRAQEGLAARDRLEARAEQARRSAGAQAPMEAASHYRRDLASVQVALQAAIACHEEFLQRQARAELLAGEVERHRTRLADAREALARSEREEAPAREATEVFRRAARAVGEAVLMRIELHANRILADAGVELEVRARWAHEGKGPARACRQCGSPYPASAKPRECARCGALRGQNIVERLELELSRQSGAAEDLAGLAFQLAAGAWLRGRRGAAWSCALLDEPFGQLDAAHRRAVARQVGPMLSGVYEQALVTAHHPGVLEALPGRIEVVAGGGGSTVRVA